MLFDAYDQSLTDIPECFTKYMPEVGKTKKADIYPEMQGYDLQKSGVPADGMFMLLILLLFYNNI